MIFDIEGVGKDVEIVCCDVFNSEYEDVAINIVNKITYIFSLLTNEEIQLFSNNVLRITYRPYYNDYETHVWFHSYDKTLRVMYSHKSDNICGVCVIEDGGISYTVADYADRDRWNNVEFVVKYSEPLDVQGLKQLDNIMFGFLDSDNMDEFYFTLREYTYCMFFSLLLLSPDEVHLRDVSYAEYDFDRCVLPGKGAKSYKNRWIRVYDSTGRSIDLLVGIETSMSAGAITYGKRRYDYHLSE